MASRGPVSRGPPASSPPFWWPLHFGMTEVYVPSDRRSALVECLANWCRAECVTSVGGGRPVRPGAMLVRQGWQGLNASSTSAQTSKAYSYDWLKATAHRHIGRGGPFPAGDRDADSCSGVRSNTYAVLLDCVEMLTSMHALDPDIASEVNAALTYQPQDALSCIGAAVCDAVFGAPPQGAAAGPTQNNFDGRAGRVFVRLVNLDREFRVSVPSVRAQSVGKLVSVVGVAVKVSTPRAIVERMDFCCAKCGAVRQVEMRGGTFDPPTRCGSNGCRSQKLVPVRRSIVCADWQKIRLQEMQQQAAAQGTQTAGDAGRIPCNLECEVRDGMIEQCCAGETVSIVGIVKTTTTGSYTSQVSLGGGNASMYSLYVDVISIEATGKGSARRLGAPNAAETPGEDADDALGCSEDTCSGDARSSAPPSTKFTERDLQFVSKFSQEYEGDQLRQLVHSLCPSILGQELVKMGMVLSMVGGVQKNADAKDRIQVRGDIHMLIVGDPGLGKSQMLKAATEASPRGVYVCGNGTTSTGLTASLGRDSDSGTFAFEAGALVLADRGVCCVDEFDKMTADRHALLEAMEQQTVSMAKAGLVASLPSRAAVIAAANPIKGHYDRSRTVNENIKLSNAMMSRFDLVFLLLDEPDAQTDKHLSEHLLALHSGNADRTSRAKHNLLECGRARRASHASSQPSCSPLMSQRSRIEDRMKLRADEDFCPLHAKLMRTYIAYVRKFVFPTLSQEAKKVIQEFYLELRASARPSDGTPITVRRHRVSIEARQLESLVRLSEARARVELRTIVTKDDALDVIEIMRASLLDRLVDEEGFVDLRRSGGQSKHAEAKRYLAALRESARNRNDPFISESELCDLADAIDLGVPCIRSFIDFLNESGELLKQGQGRYKISGASFR